MRWSALLTLETRRWQGRRRAVVQPIEILTIFPDFEAFWHPFTLGAGPAPGYCMGLPEDKRADLQRRLEQRLGGDGRVIRLPARAWAVRGG